MPANLLALVSDVPFPNALALQKLISNLYIRARDTIAMQRLDASDANLLPARVTLATPTTSNQVPRLASMRPDAVPTPGAFATRPVAYLQASTLPAIDEIVHAAAAAPISLEGLFVELQRRDAAGAGGPVYGAVVPWGMFDTQTLMCVRYAHDYVLLQSKVLQRLQAPPTATLASDTMTKMMQARPLRSPPAPSTTSAASPCRDYRGRVLEPSTSPDGCGTWNDGICAWRGEHAAYRLSIRACTHMLCLRVLPE